MLGASRSVKAGMQVHMTFCAIAATLSIRDTIRLIAICDAGQGSTDLHCGAQVGCKVSAVVAALCMPAIDLNCYRSRYEMFPTAGTPTSCLGASQTGAGHL